MVKKQISKKLPVAPTVQKDQKVKKESLSGICLTNQCGKRAQSGYEGYCKLCYKATHPQKYAEKQLARYCYALGVANCVNSNQAAFVSHALKLDVVQGAGPLTKMSQPLRVIDVMNVA